MTTTKTSEPTRMGNGDGASGIELVQEGDERILLMWGEIDASLRDRASDAIAQLFDLGGPLVIDTSRVTFMDSAGLAFLVQLCMIVDEEGLSVTLRHPTPAVRDLLEMVGMAEKLGLDPGDLPTGSSGPLRSLPTVA